MKIVLVTNLYEPYARGGAEVIVKRTAKELINQGHEVVIITAKPWSGFSSLNPERDESGDVPVIRFYPFNLFFYANDYRWWFPLRLIWHCFDLFNVHSAFVMKDILKTEQPDLIISHNLMGLGGLIPGVLKRSGIKWIHVIHDIQLAVRSGVMKQGEEQSWFVIGFVAKAYQTIMRSLFGSPDHLVSPSKFLLAFYERLGYFSGSNKLILKNPVDTKFIALSEGAGDPIKAEVIHFGYIGQLAEHKGLKTLLNAFSHITDPGIRLSIVGSGPLVHEVKQKTAMDPRIKIKGKIPNEQLPAFYRSLDATILPTETYENSPTVIYESLATGTPVIVSDIGGSAENIVSGKNGYTFNPGRTEELVSRLQQFIHDQPDMAQACRETVKGMGVERYVEKLLSLIE